MLEIYALLSFEMVGGGGSYSKADTPIITAHDN
jgi:hypothetical protein